MTRNTTQAILWDLAFAVKTLGCPQDQLSVITTFATCRYSGIKKASRRKTEVVKFVKLILPWTEPTSELQELVGMWCDAVYLPAGEGQKISNHVKELRREL